MIRHFASHPTAANLLMILFLAAGAFSISALRRETLPDFTPAEIEVRVVYPGAAAAEVEEVICQRVEDALDGVRFVHELRAEAREGVGVVVAEMSDGADYITFKDEVDSAVAAIDDFPAEVEDPVITQLHTTELVATVVVAGPMSDPDLKAHCEALKQRLQRLPEIAQVRIIGFSDHQLRVALSSAALMRHRISVADVAERIGRQSLDLPAGAIETTERDILVRFVDQRTSVQALEDLVVLAAPGGAEIRLRDLGHVRDEFERPEDRVQLGDRRAGLLNIEKTRDQDTLRVAEVLRQFLADERARVPQVELVLTRDSSTLVQDRLQLLLTNGWQGAILVFLTLWLFFSVRLSFWVVMSLPVAFMGAFFFVPMLGLTINMLTMVGLLLALGLLMDDGIVIAENIATHRARGKSPLAAAIDGVREVAGGVVSSFVTTVCVLGPLATLEGTIGKVLKVVPMILLLVMTVSLVEAFCILPAHLSHALDAPGTAGRGRQRVDRALDWLRERVLGRLLDGVLRWRYAWCGCVALVFLVAVGLFAGGVVRFQAFPDLDGDVIVARVLMPPGTPLDRTAAVVDRLREGLSDVDAAFAPRQPQGQAVVRNVYAQFNINEDSFETGPHVATLFVDLLAAERRVGRIDDLLDSWRAAVGAVPDAVSVVFTEPGLGPAGRNIEVRLHGDDLDRLGEAATALQEWFSGFAGVNNLTTDLRPGKPELRLRLQEGALGVGLDAGNLARQLRAAYQGATADEIQVGRESYEIDVQLASADQNSIADLEFFHCTLPDGRLTPLTAVAEVTQARGWSRIARVDGRRTVTVRGDVDPRATNTVALIADMRAEFLPACYRDYPEISVTFEGEIAEANTTQSSMRRALLIGLLGMFTLLSFQFRSYAEPLIVMVAIPLALVGVIAGHLLLGMDVSMPSLLGFVSLAGIVVNDSILLVLFLKNRLREGLTPTAAAAQASRERFRAIVLTSLTTIAGLSPLLFERSLQAQILIPLATSIVFGLMASTVLVLLVIPCLYVVLFEHGWCQPVPHTEIDPADSPW